MKPITVLVFIILSYSSDYAEGGITDFFANIPQDIANAWDSFLKAVRQPVRIKRLGSRGPLKPTTVPPSTVTMVDTRRMVSLMPQPESFINVLKGHPRSLFVDFTREVRNPKGAVSKYKLKVIESYDVTSIVRLSAKEIDGPPLSIQEN